MHAFGHICTNINSHIGTDKHVTQCTCHAVCAAGRKPEDWFHAGLTAAAHRRTQRHVCGSDNPRVPQGS